MNKLEFILGLILLSLGLFLYWWSSSLVWIAVYPPPIGKQVLTFLPWLLIFAGIFLLVDGLRKEGSTWN